jgi:hypothetical protein
MVKYRDTLLKRVVSLIVLFLLIRGIYEIHKLWISSDKNERKSLIPNAPSFPRGQSRIMINKTRVEGSHGTVAIDDSVKNALRIKSIESKVLVVFSGPTSFVDSNIPSKSFKNIHKKMELYRLNFEFFLRHGIQCRFHDTVLVVTQTVAGRYRPQISKLNAQCNKLYGKTVILAIRNDTCLDLESVRRALYGGFVSNILEYDYFIYINCGVTGPSPHWASKPWTDIFLSKLNDDIKMTGITMNCKFHMPHIQSMMYALDRKGLEIIMKGGAIFDCLQVNGYANMTKDERHGLIVRRYERKMSDLILESGYGISSVLRPTTIFEHNRTSCIDSSKNDTLNDLWLTFRLKAYFGKIPSLEDVIFFKTSRILTPEIAKVINFTLPITWNW